ncbi:hypothetical protein P7C70_g9140, partial [Phenoliferia sp. Uapishka_3]
MSSAYHPATNGKIERMHRVANAMFRQLVIEEQTNWAEQTPFVQFAINTTASKSSGFAPFALSKVRMPTAIPSWASAPSDATAETFIQNALNRQNQARDALLRAQIDQTHFSNLHRRSEAPRPVFKDTAPESADTPSVKKYWLSTSNLSIVPHRSRKWTPPYIGPFTCLHHDRSTSTYKLDLPERYLRRGLRNVFHASVLKPYVSNDDTRFPNRISTYTPIFPIDTLEVNIDKFIGWEWQYPEVNGEPDYNAKPTVVCLKAKLKNDRKNDPPTLFEMPHKDIPADNPLFLEWFTKLQDSHQRTYRTVQDLPLVDPFAPKVQNRRMHFDSSYYSRTST